MSRSGVIDFAVGFVGLGDMGGRIARRIAESGASPTVFDRRPDAVAGLVAAGARTAPSVAAVASASDVIGVCVIDDEQVIDVVGELIPALNDDDIVVIHSSVAPSTVRQAAAMVGRAGARLVDAPVSGSRPAADRGELTVLLGGDPDDLNRIEPLLQTYASTLVRAGTVGAGQAMKLTNNVLLHMNHLIVLEALRFARTQDLSEEAVIDAINASSGRSWVTETWGLIDDMLDDHPQAGSSVLHAMMSKEMWQTVKIARDTLLEMPLTALGVQVSPAAMREREAELRARRG